MLTKERGLEMIEDVLGIGYDSSKEKDYTTLVVKRTLVLFLFLNFQKIQNFLITPRPGRRCINIHEKEFLFFLKIY